MKKIFIACTLILSITTIAYGQLAVNPQVGLTLATLRNLEQNIKSKAQSSYQVGIDFRIGKRVYFQPGAFFSNLKTEYTLVDSNSFQAHLVRASVKLKTLIGINVVSRSLLTLRLNAGPSFDLVVDRTVSSESVDQSLRKQLEEDFKTTSFNIDAGLGADISFLTAELSYSFGLSEALKNQTAKYGTFLVTVGFLIGSTK